MLVSKTLRLVETLTVRRFARVAVVGRSGVSAVVATCASAVVVAAQSDSDQQDDKDKAGADGHEDQTLDVGGDEGDAPEQNGVDGCCAAGDTGQTDGLSHHAGTEGGEDCRPDDISDQSPVDHFFATGGKLGIDHQADGEEDRADHEEDAALEECSKEGDDPAAEAGGIGQSGVGAGREAQLCDQTCAKGRHDRRPDDVDCQKSYCDFLDGIHAGHPVLVCGRKVSLPSGTAKQHDSKRGGLA